MNFLNQDNYYNAFGGLANVRFMIIGDGVELELDMVSSLNGNFSSNISENPLEDGSAVQDHVTILPYEFTVSGKFSDMALYPVQPAIPVKDFYLGRAVKKFNQLVEFQKNKTQLTVKTGLRLLNNVLIENLYEKKNDDTLSIEFEIQFKQLNLVQQKVVSRNDVSDAGILQDAVMSFGNIV